MTAKSRKSVRDRSARRAIHRALNALHRIAREQGETAASRPAKVQLRRWLA